MRKIYISLLLLISALSVNICKATITLISPNGGQVWAGCTVQNITWTGSASQNNYSIDYSINGGTSWVSVTSSLNITNHTYAWTVPNISSVACLVRVTDSNNPGTFGISASTFSITAPLLLTSPTGGQSWQAGSTQSITWVANGTSDVYDIFYSTDAGNSWFTIVTDLSNPQGTYSWTVPNTPSAQCLVKIQDHTDYSCMVNVSTNLFTISPPTPYIHITNPSSAESFYVGNAYSITWTSGYITSNYVKIDYSTNNGSNWIPVTTSTTNSGSYSWTVPNTPSKLCLVKITDLGSPSVKDSSHVDFTIAEPTITVIAPNSATDYYVGSAYSISWTSYDMTTNYVNIYYSTNNGLAWLPVATSVSNNGSYAWTVPNTPSAQCKVKVADAAYPAIKDSSHVDFIIAEPGITVVSPNGGETWTDCYNQTITWSYFGTSGNFNIQYSTNNGASWTSVANNVSGTSYIWNNIQLIPSSNYLIKVSDYYNATTKDSSNNVFSVIPNTDIILHSPNGGEVWPVASQQTISWSAASTSTQFSVYYSTNNGSTWTLIVNGTSANSVLWSVPYTPSTNCLIKVYDYNDNCKNAVSSNTFTIPVPAPVITVNNPYNGLTWYTGNSYNITWSTEYLSTNFVKIDYSTNNGTSWINIINGVTNNGSYSWLVPAVNSAICKVRVSDYNNNLTNGVSSGEFTIAPQSLILTSPVGGVTWTSCHSQNITWSAYGLTTYVNVLFSNNGGKSWQLIGTSSNGDLAWSPNVKYTQNDCYIKIQENNNSSVEDSCKTEFTVEQNTDIILDNPTGGESYYPGSNIDIQWVAAPTSLFFSVYYSTGGSYTEIASEVTNDYFNWTVPNVPSTDCSIRIYDYNNNCVMDSTTTKFTILPGIPQVTSPNGGQEYYVGTAYNITWTEQYYYTDFVTIQYSTNNGSSWLPIANAASNSGTYSWTVPNTLSQQCLVKVSDYNNASVYAVSANVFTITKIYIALTYPEGGQNWTACYPETITWNRYGVTDNVNVMLSTNGGKSWQLLTTSNGTSYSYTPNYLNLVPGNNGIGQSPFTDCLIKIQSNVTPSIKDSSTAPFTITPNTDIIINSPLGGNVWPVASSQSITWSAAPSSYEFYVNYSTNNGTNWLQIANGTYANAVSWTIPYQPSAQCRIEISDYNNTCKYVVSNLFTIPVPPPVINVTSPYSGETLYQGNTYSITWSTQYLTTSFMDLAYSTDNGNSWINIINGVTNNGSYSWVAPATYSTHCKVRVMDYSADTIFGVSASDFTIAPQSIVLTNPTGGQNWTACYSETITWNRYGNTDNVNVDVSTDGGHTWLNLTSTTASSYVWTPNYSNLYTGLNGKGENPFTDSYIKIQSTVNPAVKDSSHASFTITPNTDIIINSPNGGETWPVGSSQNISWAAAPTSFEFNVYYSVDNGSIWTLIDNETYSDAVTWTIPDNPSPNSLIRVQDYNNSCIYDVSNAVFTIPQPAPVITITSPNPGVTLYSNNSYQISWTTQYLTTNYMDIAYSTNNGTSWINIINGTSNNGSYLWNVPQVSSTKCLVKVSDHNNSSTFGVSTEDFTIAPQSLQLTNPAAGAILKSCESETIIWERFGVSDNVAVLVSYNGGINWQTITSGLSGYSCYWTPDVNAVNDNCYIKVQSMTNPALRDSCHEPLTLNPNNDIIVTYPNGSDSLRAGSVVKITWASAPTSTEYSVYYTTDGVDWNVITSSTYNQYYNWTVPNVPSSSCKIKVVDYNNSCIVAYSNSYFTILPGLPQVTAPSAGQSLYYGSTYTITWTNNYYYTYYVYINYSLNNGRTWMPVAFVADNTGSFVWNVPATFSDSCLIKVGDYTNPSWYAVNSGIVSINPGLTLVTPNGDNGIEQWRTCTQTTIIWTSGGGSGSYNIEYSINNGVTWNEIVSAYSSGGSDNSYNWNMPNIPSTQCLVKVTDNNYPLKTATSASTFTIKPCIIITSPNGGESLTSGETYPITWTTNGASNYYNIDYSINGGSTWTNIIYNQNITDSTYNWLVPAVSSANSLIRITDNVNTCKTDISQNTFAIGIAYPSITITNPEGASVLTGCANYNITWNATNTSNYYTLEYSADNGNTWNLIISDSYILNRTYTWKVPNISSSTCLLKVSDYNNLSVTDQSNAVFTINPSYTASITIGGLTTFCQGSSVLLTSGSSTGNTWSPGGQTSQSITVNSSGNYSLTVNNSGCTALSQTVTVTVIPTPSAPVASSNSPVPLNGTLMLYASVVPDATYAWTGPNSFSANIINPDIANATSALNGTYSVKAVVNGCQSSAATTNVTVLTTPSNVVLQGTVMTESGVNINGVKLKLNGSGADDSIVTGSNGTFSFVVQQGEPYTITPSGGNEANAVNGITSLDLVLIQRDILDIQPLGSPYKIIAADVNESSNVSDLDILLIKSLILGNTTSFPGNKQWAYVNSDFVFTNPLVPFPYENIRSYSSANSLTDQNFIGVRLGDVNDSWTQSEKKNDAAGSVTFITDSVTVQPGSNITIPVKVKNFNQISAFQFTICWNDTLLSYSGTENAAVETSTGNSFVNAGKLTMLWSIENPDGITLPDGAVLFNLNFKVIGSAGQSDRLLFNSAYTPALAYNYDSKDVNVLTDLGNIIISNQLTTNNYQLKSNNYYLQNIPNPFNDITTIMFSIPVDSKVAISVIDIMSKELVNFNNNYPKGLNRISWDGRDGNGVLMPAGTYFIKFNTQYFSKTIKAVKL